MTKEFWRWFYCTIYGALTGAMVGALYAFVTTEAPEETNG